MSIFAFFGPKTARASSREPDGPGEAPPLATGARQETLSAEREVRSSTQGMISVTPGSSVHSTATLSPAARVDARCRTSGPHGRVTAKKMDPSPTRMQVRHTNADQRLRSRREDNKLKPEDRAAHDWYRFVLSYPAHLVRDYLARFGMTSRHRVLDPFCGTGTTIVECKKLGIPSVGVEANPMAAFAGRVKVDWTPNPDGLARHAREVAEAAAQESADAGHLGHRREAACTQPSPSCGSFRRRRRSCCWLAPSAPSHCTRRSSCWMHSRA